MTNEEIRKVRCDICFEEKDDSDKYFFKWPDAGREGADVEGFCCGECSHLPPEEQYELLKASIAAKRAKTEGWEDR